MACESDQWILTYQLSRSHDQGGRKLPPQKLMCGSFRPPIFSSPDPKGHVSYCHHWSSVRPLTFHILINSSETTGPI